MPSPAAQQLDAIGWLEWQPHLLDGTLADDMPSALEHREAETPIQLLASDWANKLCLVAWLEVSLRRDIGCICGIFILGKPVVATYNDQMHSNMLSSNTAQKVVAQ